MTGLRWDAEFRSRTGTHRLYNPATGAVHDCRGRYDSPAYVATPAPEFQPEPKPQNTYPLPNYAAQAAALIAATPTSPVLAHTGLATNGADLKKLSDDLMDTILAVTTKLSTEIKSGDKANSDALASSAQLFMRAINETQSQIAVLETKINSTVKLEIVKPSGEPKLIGQQHKLFPDLLNYVGLGLNVLLVGPAGGGKTTATEKVAEALGLHYYLQPMGPAMTESRLLGWMDANGKLVRTLFRDCYEFGGLFCADEIDNSNASALTVLNGALANGQVGFPDGMISRHADFHFVGCANTYGRGADRMYVGRQQLDGATLDRFLTLDWDYDEEFEFQLAGADQADWINFVWRVRKIAFTHKLRVLVTPRAAIEGAKLLRAGIPREKVENVRLFASMPADALATIRQNLKTPSEDEVMAPYRVTKRAGDYR
jgi:MoxR-like ATPase